MALDLSSLEDKPAPVAADAAPARPNGRPLEIPLADIDEDPDQPRQEFSAEAMADMTASIKERGVKTPVSVRAHPTKPGKWMLNHGARRYRGSIAAGRTTIPCILDEVYDAYDQVIENIQRDDLKPMELALFIKKRMDAGEKGKVIAKQLGKDPAIITQHMALIDAPACIEDAYTSGKCTSPKTLYELRSLQEKFPEQVDAWYENQAEITRKSVSELADELKGNKKPPVSPEAGAPPAPDAGGKIGHDQFSDSEGRTDFSGQQTGQESSGDADTATDTGKGAKGGSNDGDGQTSFMKNKAPADPERLSKPLLLVEFDGRAAVVILNKRPSAEGLIFIRYDDDGGTEEVDAGACKINRLTEE
jgi:ParB family chromosome partitioning protein